MEFSEATRERNTDPMFRGMSFNPLSPRRTHRLRWSEIVGHQYLMSMAGLRRRQSTTSDALGPDVVPEAMGGEVHEGVAQQLILPALC
jgi:hypothetical protein